MAGGGAPAWKGPAAWPGGRPRAGWRERRGGGRKSGPPGSPGRARTPRAPRAAGLTGPRAPRSAENRARIKVGGGGEEQGEASGVLNASRVRLIIKLIKASI